MSDAVNIHALGAHINFPTWEKFNLEDLTNDGVVLFQYLLFHCQHNAEWTHSDIDIERELGIKRVRLSVLRKKFTDAQILQTRIVRNKYNNKITAYRLNFLELSKPASLRLIYRSFTPSGEAIDLDGYSKLYKTLHESQPKKSATGEKKAANEQLETNRLVAHFTNLFNKQRREFNDQQRLDAEKHSTELVIAAGSIRFSARQTKKLLGALDYFKGNQPFVEGAFIAFTDALNESAVGIETDLLPKGPIKSPLDYFLNESGKIVDKHGQYDDNATTDNFPAIYFFGNYHAANYSRQ